MLDIIVLIFLVIHMGKLAQQKGLKPGPWKLYTVLGWFGGEIIGAFLGILLFGMDNIVSVVLMAIAGAITGYLFVKSKLNKIPDNIEEDINRIGVDDLRP